jgi:hypothetical protein
VINANFIPGLFGGSTAMTLSGNTLFVANFQGIVGKYDVTTGAVTNANFITGLQQPFGLAAKNAK